MWKPRKVRPRYDIIKYWFKGHKEAKIPGDTGAEISIIGCSSLTPQNGILIYEGVDIKGISNTVMKTEGTMDLKLFTDTHETTHTFYVLRENSDAILGMDFFETKDRVINYCSCQIIMNYEVIVNFHPKPTANKTTVQANVKG